MSFYNIDFEVKYNNIHDELLDKIKLNTDANIKSEYNEDDIFSICTNLYQHELISVFYATSLLDDKIDKGIEKVYNNWLSKYEPLMQILDNSKMLLFTYDNETCNLTSLQKQNLEKNSRYFLLLMLFSENMFYITHQCICQLIKNSRIELPLLNDFEIELNKMLKSKF
jgi:hypothetical protein